MLKFQNSSPSDVEEKFFDLVLNNTHVIGTVLSPPFVGIAQGTGQSARIGRSIHLTNLSMRIHWNMGELYARDNASVGDTGRLVLYIDHQANGALPAVSDIFIVGNLRSQQLFNPNETARFTIIYDESVDLNRKVLLPNNFSADTGDYGATPHHYSTYYTPLDLDIIYQGDGGDIADIMSNSIGAVFSSNFSVLRLRFTARIRFSDSDQ